MTYFLERKNVSAAVRRLAGMEGVDQIAPFGLSVHVVGQNRALLNASLERVVRETGVTAREGETSLEDVFIQFMGKTADNMG